MIGGNASGGPGTITGLTCPSPVGAGCFNWSYYSISSRTQWNITPSFYVGFDVMYQRLETAFGGSALFTAAANLPRPTLYHAVVGGQLVVSTSRQGIALHVLLDLRVGAIAALVVGTGMVAESRHREMDERRTFSRANVIDAPISVTIHER